MGQCRLRNPYLLLAPGKVEINSRDEKVQMRYSMKSINSTSVLLSSIKESLPLLCFKVAEEQYKKISDWQTISG
jgi:hypothetical protein